MSLVHGTEIVAAAQKGHYAIGAFNTNNLEWSKAILAGAQAKNTPIIIQSSMGAAKYMGGYELIQHQVQDLIKSMHITVPIILHLDHGNYDAAKAAIAAGYTSVMFDGHDLDFQENLEKTKEIVALAHENGISVEAEVGSIGGEEDGIVGEGELADVEEAKTLAATGIDFLAAGIGNIHGIYPANWTGLHFDRLQELKDAVPVPLVLHGGSGIPKDQIIKAISLGVAKVNVNTENQVAFTEATRQYIEAGKDHDSKGFDPRKILAPGTAAIQKTVEERIEWFGTKPIKLVPEEL